MISIKEHVEHISCQMKEYCFAFQNLTNVNVKGGRKYYPFSYKKEQQNYNLYFSYDGFVYHKHADSKYAHYFTSLAIIDDVPLATGGGGDDYTFISETYNYVNNTWTEVNSFSYENL